jgi:hypothetical protein
MMDASLYICRHEFKGVSLEVLKHTLLHGRALCEIGIATIGVQTRAKFQQRKGEANDPLLAGQHLRINQ